MLAMLDDNQIPTLMHVTDNNEIACSRGTGRAPTEAVGMTVVNDGRRHELHGSTLCHASVHGSVSLQIVLRYADLYCNKSLAASLPCSFK